MLQNPSNLYSAGNVVLDSSPYLRMAVQARERKAAREEAVDKYYQNLPNTLNDKGLRDQEVPIVSDLKNKMFEYWVGNKEALKKGDPNAQLGLQRLYRQASSVVREGLNASKNDMTAGQMAMKKENLPVLTSPYFIEKHQRAMLPVTDPNYEPLNMPDILANRPFDQSGFVKEIKGNFKYGEDIPTITPHPTDRNLEVVTTNPKLDDATKVNLYAYAADKYNSDPTFRKKIDTDYSSPEQLAKLNEVSKKIFGHEINEPEDVAAAYAVSVLPNTATRASVRTNIDTQHAFQEHMLDRRQDEARKMAYLNDALIKGRKEDGAEDEESIAYPTVKYAERYGEKVNITKPNGEKATVIYVDADTAPRAMMEVINPMDKNKGLFPIKPLLIKDNRTGKNRKVWEFNPETGNWKGMNGEIDANYAKDVFVNKLYATNKKIEVGTKGKFDYKGNDKPKKKYNPKTGKFE